jgi:hypothetical protein
MTAVDASRVSAPVAAPALRLFALLHARGGCMRMRPLLAASGLPDEALADALDDLSARCWILDDLSARCWIRIAWRPAAARDPDALPAILAERLRAIDRVATTPFGRWRYAVTW